MKSSKGFTLVELMIVVAVVGILAGIAIPNFLNLKDKAIWGTARANLEVVRTALANYAAGNENNSYPVGDLDFAAFRNTIPKAMLPATEKLARFSTDTFSYTSADGRTFSVSVSTDNRAFDPMVASPNGITPASYDDYVR